MRIQHPIPLLILFAGLGWVGSSAATATESAARHPPIPALAYGYGDPGDRWDRDDDRRGWHGRRHYDEAIHAQVERALWRALGERARAIDVGVRGGYVILSGQVDSRRDRDYAFNVAANTRGVRAVENRIYVRRTWR